MNIKYKLSSIAASFLLAACTSENTLEPPTPPDEGTASANNTREVLLSLKNKLKVSPVGTKAGDVIATVDKKIWINHKRVKLHVAAAELYPEDYDFSIIFDTVENRKLRHQMERKYVEGAEIVTDN